MCLFCPQSNSLWLVIFHILNEIPLIAQVYLLNGVHFPTHQHKIVYYVLRHNKTNVYEVQKIPLKFKTI